MARARNIKPSIFKNEVLGVADPLLTILFESLWCLADREGRLEDRPLRIKAETFPYRENLDVNGYLTELQRTGFIQRYMIDGIALIQVVNFKKHQAPHNTEKASELPAPTSESLISCGLREITVKQPLNDCEKTEALPPDSLLLIPDSLIPDSLVVAQDKPEPKKRKTQIAQNFEPNETGKRKAVDKGLSCVEELLKFKDYHSAKGSVMADWQAAWRTWVANARVSQMIGKSIKPVSFRQTDDEIGMQRWEQMTGRDHPDREPKIQVFDENHNKEIGQ